MIKKHFTQNVNFLISESDLEEVDRIATERAVSRGNIIRESLKAFVQSCNNNETKEVTKND